MPRTSHVALAATVAVTALASACGGGDAAPLSHSALVSRADGLCRAYSADLTRTFAGAQTPKAIDHAYGTYLAKFDQLVVDLRALRPPKGDASAYDAWLDAAVRERPLIEATRPPATKADTGRLWFAISRVDHLAAALGMHECATSVDSHQEHMTRARYAQVAGSVCYSASAAFDLLPNPTDPAEFSSEIRRLEPVFEETQRDLHAIPVPEGDEQPLAAWLRLRDRTAAEILAMRDAADAADPAAFRRLSKRVSADAARAGASAQAYGMPECAGSAA